MPLFEVAIITRSTKKEIEDGPAPVVGQAQNLQQVVKAAAKPKVAAPKPDPVVGYDAFAELLKSSASVMSPAALWGAERNSFVNYASAIPGSQSYSASSLTTTVGGSP